MSDHSMPTDPPTFWQFAYARRSVMVVDVVDMFATFLMAIAAVLIWTPLALVGFLALQAVAFFVTRRVEQHLNDDDVFETTAEEADRFRNGLRVAELTSWLCVIVLAGVLHG